MIDLRLVREHPDRVKASQRARGAEESRAERDLTGDVTLPEKDEQGAEEAGAGDTEEPSEEGEE